MISKGTRREKSRQLTVLAARPNTSGSYSKQLEPSTTSKFCASQNAVPFAYSWPEKVKMSNQHDLALVLRKEKKKELEKNP